MIDRKYEGLKKYKIVFVGNDKTGKSSLIKRFKDDSFEPNYLATIGTDFISKQLSASHLGSPIFSIWDTSGQQRFRCMIESYLRQSLVVVITYDITNRVSFLAVEDWIKEIHNAKAEQAVIVLVGTKADLIDQRTVTTEEAQAFAKKHNISYREVSAKSGYGIVDLFEKDIVSLLTIQNAMPYPDLQQRIKSLKEKYPKDKTVEAITDILRTGLSQPDPQAFFNAHFTTGKSNNLRTHLNTLAYRWRSILTSVLNVVIAVLQKVCAGVHALGYCLGLARQQTTAYPAFYACGEKQAAKNLCNDVLETVRATPRV